MYRLTTTFILSILTLTLTAQEFLIDADSTEFFDCSAFYNPTLEPSQIPYQELTINGQPPYWYQKTVPTVVHVLYSDSIPDSYVPYDNIVEAIDNLNNQFEGTDFSFELLSVDHTEVLEYPWGQLFVDEDICFYNNIVQMDDYANDVNWNTNEYMNIYVVPKLCRTLLGFSWVHFNPYSDVYGVWVHQRGFGLTGDYLDYPFTENKTLSHEVGHYLGLHHVFFGVTYCGQSNSSDGVPCEYDGDMVCDTPPTKVNYSCVNPICPPALYGYTPNNHMDYYVDSCRTAFTDGQINRMHMMTDYHHADMFDQGEPYCNGDLDGNGYVGSWDLLLFLQCYNGNDGNIYDAECIYADLDNNGVLTTGDLNLMLSYYDYDCSTNPNLFTPVFNKQQRQQIINNLIHE